MERPILVTGTSGFAGFHLARALAARGPLVGTVLHHPVAIEGVRTEILDLGDREAVDRLLAALRPSAVVHTAGLTKTGMAERDPAEATRANDAGTRNLVEALDAHANDAPLIHFSTDLVYPGDRPRWREDDPVAPVMHYGRTKLAAEGHVRSRRGPWTILRCALMYGPPAPWAGGATGWILDALTTGRALDLFEDEFRSPVHTSDVVAAVERLLDDGGDHGVINLGGADRVSRHLMGRLVAEAYRLDPALVRATSQSAVELDSPRPADVSMDSSLATDLLGRPTLSFRTGLHRLSASVPLALA